MRSVSRCVRYSPLEHAHERYRTADLSCRRAAQGNGQSAIHRRYSARGAAHGAIVHSTIASGRTVSIDTTAAEKAPGVLAVFTYRNMPRMNPTPKPWSHLHPHGQSYLPLQDDKIHYAGQPIAFVVAETLDQASYAGTLITVKYDSQRPVVFDPQALNKAVNPPQFLWPVASSVGDADKAIAAATVKVEQTYSTADRHHNQMEPHATTAVWDAWGTLTLYETTQHIFGTKELVAIVLGMPPTKINVVSEFLGGGFGGKGYVWPHTLMAAARARFGTGQSACSSPARRCIRWSAIRRLLFRRLRWAHRKMVG